MTLLAHQTEQRFPSIAGGEARVVTAPLIAATPDSLAGYAEVVADFATAAVHIVPWPVSGWRKLSPGTGVEGGTTEGLFSVWREGGLLFGRNEAVGRAYILGWYDDPATARREREPQRRDRLFVHEANYHPDGGQVWCPRQGRGFVALLAKPGDDVRPEDFVAFLCDGAFGIQLLPGVWHHPPVPLGDACDVDDRQGKVHACVDVDFLGEFGCYLEIPLGRQIA